MFARARPSGCRARRRAWRQLLADRRGALIAVACVVLATNGDGHEWRAVRYAHFAEHASAASRSAARLGCKPLDARPLLSRPTRHACCSLGSNEARTRRPLAASRADVRVQQHVVVELGRSASLLRRHHGDADAGGRSSAISFLIFVYRANEAPSAGAAGADASADAAADANAATDGGADTADAGVAWRPDLSPASCGGDRLLARSASAIDLAPGDYFVCNSPGGCTCLKVRLTGGPASFVWEAGPGGGNRGVTGCADAIID